MTENSALGPTVSLPAPTPQPTRAQSPVMNPDLSPCGEKQWAETAGLAVNPNCAKMQARAGKRGLESRAPGGGRGQPQWPARCQHRSVRASLQLVWIVVVDCHLDAGTRRWHLKPRL